LNFVDGICEVFDDSKNIRLEEMFNNLGLLCSNTGVQTCK
jgi:hypothetical protein